MHAIVFLTLLYLRFKGLIWVERGPATLRAERAVQSISLMHLALQIAELPIVLDCAVM